MVGIPFAPGASRPAVMVLRAQALSRVATQSSTLGNLLVVAAIAAVALVLAAMAWLVLTRFVAARRRLADALVVVDRQLHVALADPVLVHQARRRIMEARTRRR